jgi:hypothetical protein
VRQFDCAIYEILSPIIGPYCHLLGHDNDNFIINIETGVTFQHIAKLLPLEKRSTAASAEDVRDPSPICWLTELPVTPNSWPFYNCVGQLAPYEPRHRNRFYLYSLSDF